MSTGSAVLLHFVGGVPSSSGAGGGGRWVERTTSLRPSHLWLPPAAWAASRGGPVATAAGKLLPRRVGRGNAQRFWISYWITVRSQPCGERLGARSDAQRLHFSRKALSDVDSGGSLRSSRCSQKVCAAIQLVSGAAGVAVVTGTSQGSAHVCQVELRGILCGLRRCLKTAGVERLSDRFHYAEALVYTQPEEWWPLLGNAFDILDDDRWPSDYRRLFQDLDAPDVRVTSMLALLAQRKTANTVFRPLLRPLSQRRQTAIRGHALQRAETEVSPSYIPGIDCYFLDSDPTEESKNFGRYLEVARQYPKYYPPLESGLMLLIPLTGQLVGVSVILAQVIIMLDIPDIQEGDWFKTLSKDILPALDAFSRAGSALLLDRHEHLLIGYNPSPDISALFVHPALTRPTHTELLTFKDLGSHEDLKDFRLGYDGQGGRDGWPFLTVFKRNIQSFTSLPAYERPGSLACARQLADEAAACADQIQPSIPPDRTAFRKTLHRWLKALYAESSDGRPGTNYLLFPEHLVLLAATLSAAIQPRLTSSGRREVWQPTSEELSDPRTWPCSILLSTVPASPSEPTRFSWPVVPGVRFLLPFLKLLDDLPGILRAQAESNLTMVSVLFEAGAVEVPERKGNLPFSNWRKWSEKGDEQKCGVILQVSNVDDPGVFRRGINRQLITRHKRMGGTTHLFHDVLSGELSRVEGVSPTLALASRASDTPDITFDLETIDDSTLLIAFSWTPPSDSV